jgi:ubiquinone/menaquinone biosynthesis C-methylase UbiE
MAIRKSELYFEEIGSSFDKWASPYDVQQRVRLINAMMPHDSLSLSCLEVGCGRGSISEKIAPKVAHFMVADISAQLAQYVGTRLNVEWRKEDVCNLTFQDESFDLVVSSECIEHTVDPRRALAEMARVVRKNGTLIVTSPNKIWYPILWLSMKIRLRRFSGNETWLFPSEAVQLLNKKGFMNIMVSGCHLFPWQLPLARSVLPFFDRFGRQLYPLMINFCIAARRDGRAVTHYAFV